MLIGILTNEKKSEPLTGVWQKWRFSTPQTHLWLIKVWFSASTFVVKIATFAKRQTVSDQCEKPTAQTAHLVLPIHEPTLKNQMSCF